MKYLQFREHWENYWKFNTLTTKSRRLNKKNKVETMSGSWYQTGFAATWRGPCHLEYQRKRRDLCTISNRQPSSCIVSSTTSTFEKHTSFRFIHAKCLRSWHRLGDACLVRKRYGKSCSSMLSTMVKPFQHTTAWLVQKLLSCIFVLFFWIIWDLIIYFGILQIRKTTNKQTNESINQYNIYIFIELYRCIHMHGNC